MDGKRETTISQLLITPTDLDIGRVYVCRCSNDAIPAGKEASIKLNVHRKETLPGGKRALSFWVRRGPSWPRRKGRSAADWLAVAWGVWEQLEEKRQQSVLVGGGQYFGFCIHPGWEDERLA